MKIRGLNRQGYECELIVREDEVVGTFRGYLVDKSTLLNTGSSMQDLYKFKDDLDIYGWLDSNMHVLN